MRITLTETEKQIVTQLNHSMVTVEFLEEWVNQYEEEFDRQNPYGTKLAALAKGYYTAVQRLAALRTGLRPIDRDYALKQAELGIKEAKTDEEKATFIRLRDFLKVLPSPEDLDQHVYCTQCGHFSAEEDHLSCPYENLCYFWNPEDSMPRRVRWCYTEQE